MSARVDFRVEDGVAVATLASPPVNALGIEIRHGLVAALERSKADTAIKAVILASQGKMFSGGADITEFDRPPVAPILADVIEAVSTLGKPVVAAIQGTALGGAVELALACAARVVSPGARLGLPEVKLGLIPGAGGTQRLPRAIGAAPAFAMMLKGDPISAAKALELGLVEGIAEGDLIAAAKAKALDLASRLPQRRIPLPQPSPTQALLCELAIIERPHPRADADGRGSPVADVATSFPLPEGEGQGEGFRTVGQTGGLCLDSDRGRLAREGERADFEKVAARAAKEHAGKPNVSALIEAVRAAFDKPLPEGLAFERQLFLQLRDDERSKALRYAFFAERKAAKVKGLPPETKTRPIGRAAVIGAGTMGTGIAICFLNAGIPVALIEDNPEALSRGFGRIEATLDDAVRRGKSSPEARDQQIALVSSSLDLEDAADADIAVEAVFEDMALKKEIFARLGTIAKPGAILATNTSYLDIDEIASATSRPEDVLGLHFFSPANIMRLVEIVRAEKTAPDVLKTAAGLAQKLGKVSVTVGVCHGFAGNRMLARRHQQAERLLIEGALPQPIDAAMVDFGFRMGPFAVADLAGLDIGWRMRKATGAKAAIADALCERGRLGQKTGKGWYIYTQGARGGVADPDVERLIEEVSAALGVQRRLIPADEIAERLIFPMVNEGARILGEGIAARASDIDVIWMNGYGWPAWRGGPMYYADRAGLPYVAAKLEAFACATGDESLLPSPVLRELAESGRTFTEAYP
jgi:3-hydroxyacyl-CoA dehydrogenase